MSRDTISVARIGCDFLVLVCCAIPLLIFHEFVPPYKRGFYCDDETIRYPFRKSTVSRQMLIVVGLLIPSALILLTELFRATVWEKPCRDQFKTYHMRNHSVHRLIVRLYCFLGYFFVGVCFNQLMVDIAKYSIGRPRPHFIDVCRPSVGYKTCANPDEYIENFNCTGIDKGLIHESRLSFYSGHAAFSFYAAWFTALYLQARLYRPLFSRLTIPVVQFLLFGGAAYVAYTRVSDYKHHWSDVLVGAIMGSSIGIFVAVYVAEVFMRREVPLNDPKVLHDQFGLIRVEPEPAIQQNGDPVVSTQSHTIHIQDETGPQAPTSQRLSTASLCESFYTAAGDWPPSLLSSRPPSTIYASAEYLPLPSRAGSLYAPHSGHYNPTGRPTNLAQHHQRIEEERQLFFEKPQ